MTVAWRTQGICSRARRRLRERDEEEVASDVGAEDGEEIGAAQLAVAEGLDGGGGIDAEAGIVIEEAARGDEKSGDDAERGQEGSGESQLAPAGTSPGGKEAATDGNAAAGAEEGLFGSRRRGRHANARCARRNLERPADDPGQPVVRREPSRQC